MTVRPPAGIPLPELVLVAGRVLGEEAEALRVAMKQFGSAPQPGSPWIQDDETIADRADTFARGRATLLRYARQQASLIYVNVWDHLSTLARILGRDEAMPLFSQASVSRVVCEAAVRFAWLMDPDISSAKRLVRGAAALHYSAEQRSKGVQALPAERFDPHTYRQMLDSCSQERESVRKLIEDAGMTFGSARKGNAKVRLELRSPSIAIPLKVDITRLMAGLLPDSLELVQHRLRRHAQHLLGPAGRQPLPSRRVSASGSRLAGRRCCRRVRDLRLHSDPRPVRENEWPRPGRPRPARSEAPRRSRCPHEARRHLSLGAYTCRTTEPRIKKPTGLTQDKGPTRACRQLSATELAAGPEVANVLADSAGLRAAADEDATFKV